MSKQNCDNVCALIAQAAAQIKSGVCGETSKSTAMALTHCEDALLRLHHHMREQGWTIGTGAAPKTVHDTAQADQAREMAIANQPRTTVMPFEGKDTGTMHLAGLKAGQQPKKGPQRPPENQQQLLGLFS